MSGPSGIRRLEMYKAMEDVAPQERDRHVPPSTPLGDDEPEPTLNQDGSATFELPADEVSDVIENPDGSATVDLLNDAPAETESSFVENLAEKLDETLLSRLATQLIDDAERDRDARKKRDEQYAEGIKRTGLGNEAPGGATFDGASRAVHPVLIEGCVDFSARAMKELFPANGPVKAKIVGDATKLKLQKADRKTRYMNWQTTTQIKEYRRDLEVLLTQLPLGGVQYLKVWQDPRWERARTEFVPVDDLLVPFEATNLMTASRVTHVQKINRATFEERTESGLYREIPSTGDDANLPDSTASAEAAAKVEGVEDIGFNEDGLRTIYESQVYLELKGEDKDPLAKRTLMPYVLTVDLSSRKVLSLYRNWDEEDQDKAEALAWIVEFPFIPWRGAYAIGLTHLIGSLSGAATGALRALLDSAHINNMPGALKLKGARATGQDVQIAPTQLTDIDAGPGVDDIRKLAMPLPFNPPSAVLFQLLEWISVQAKGVVATAEERIADASNNMPVGTALALIEQGSITFSAIHGRLHQAQKQVLAIIHRLNAKYLTDREVVEELGELVVSRQDFQGPVDIEPVSDPNIFSDAQRYAQLQAAMQLQAQAPQLYKLPELHKRALKLLKFPAPDEVLAVPGDPEELDAVDENVAAADPLKAVKVYEGQDHVQHLKTHLAYMTSPIYCANPLMATPTLPVLLQHCKEHITMLYGEHAEAADDARAAVAKMTGVVKGSESDALAIVDQELVKELGPLMPLLQQSMQLAQQLAPKPPGDPAIAVAQMRQQSEQAKLELEKQRFGFEQQVAQMTQQQAAMKQQLEEKLAMSGQMLEQQRRQAEDQLAAADIQMQQRRDAMDAQNNTLQLQLQARIDQAAHELEAWQTRVELETSKHNADLAAMQGAEERALKLQLAEMSERHQKELAALNGRIDLILEQAKQAGAHEAREHEAELAPEPPKAEGGPK